MLPTTVPFIAALVVIGFLVMVVVVFAMAHVAGRRGHHYEADLKAASFRFSVRIHPQPPAQEEARNTTARLLPSQGIGKNQTDI